MSNNQNKKQNYQIISLIGQGAYGQVYKARKRFTGQFVAIKSIKKKGKQQKDIKAMRQQIQILKKLKHQNIILLLDSFQTQNQFILVTQLGQGQLFNIIQDDQSIDIQETRKIAQQLVRALYYIHSNRITHRDMKPQNVLMTSDGVIKLCDFGFARSMSYKTQVLTSLKGTPLYMAPQVVKQEPYNHTADLWSLGVILYQLATGNPPFTAPNLISLVQHISKDPIHYPQNITGDFKNFLKGLLNKDPKKRLAWPQLLHHPFIRETDEQKKQRKRKTQKFSSWLQQNIILQEQNSQKNSQNSSTKYIPMGGYQQKNQKDISPKKEAINNNVLNQCSDTVWNKYYSQSGDQKGCQLLRSDTKFQESFLQVISIGINQFIRIKQKRKITQTAIKTLIQILIKSKSQLKKIDIAKNSNISYSLLVILKNLLKIDYGKQYIEIISDIIKLIGLLARITFHKQLGIQMIYIRSFIPLFPSILKSIYQSNDQNYVNNFLRTVGMFANNASANHIRSFSFYKDIVQIKFIQESIEIIRYFYQNINVLKLYVQVLSALIHPVFGDIECFPWKKINSTGIIQFKQFLTMSECVRQSVINTLLQNNWIQFFEKILSLQDESAVLPKISMSRILLHSVRFSKDFNEALITNGKNILKYLYKTLQNNDQIIYVTSCLVLSQCLKYIKQKQKQKFIQKQLPFITESVLNSLKQLLSLLKLGKQLLKQSNLYLITHGSLLILYQILGLQMPQNNQKILNFFNTEKCLTFLSIYLSQTQKNKLQELRKIQGSNYGIHTYGIYDSIFLILHRINVKITKHSNVQFINNFATNLIKSKIAQNVAMFMKKLSSKTDISPRGFVAYLIFVSDLINLNISQQFVQQYFIKNLIQILKQSQVQSLLEWPVAFGGGQTCLTIIFGNLNLIILNLLRISQKYPQIPKILYEFNLIQHIVSFAKFLNQQNIGSIISILSHLLVLDKNDKNQKLDNTFAKQFINAGGMSLFNRFNLLQKQIYEPSSLIDNFNFLSLLARSSKQFYQYIDSINPFQQISILLNHSDPQLRAKVLNLIGNLCRHSSYFYKKLYQLDIITKSIKLCEDPDKTIKKFACVVIGNASFHDASLYQVLRPTIPTLINLIKDSQQKTRSNAAAALGNLARNSNLLDKDFVKSGANFQLLNLFSVQKSISCKRVCVMALMNLLSLPQSKKILESQNIEALVKKFIPPNYNGDPGLIKACQKTLQKLQQKIQ